MDGEELRHQGTRLGREHRGRIEMGRRWRVGWLGKGARMAGEWTAESSGTGVLAG